MCKKHGILRIKQGDIEIDFGAEVPKQAPRGRHVTKELSPDDEYKIKEERLSTMLIENPLEYEELLLKDGYEKN